MLLGLLIVSRCGAESSYNGCSACGCHQLKKICKVVPDVKKVTKTSYVVECEDVCLPGKSHYEQRLVTDPNCVDLQRLDLVKIPTCDRIVTKKKLKKTTTTVDKPGWKCVVETVCCQCGELCVPQECGK